MLCYHTLMKFLKRDIKGSFKKWLPLGFSITAVFLFGYVIVQQDLRMGVNDTQAEIAGNVDLALGEGTPYKFFNSANPVKIGKSLTPYLILYGLDGKPLGGNGAMEGNYPTPPKGVFDYVLSHKEDRFTWEPKPGVREAVVIRLHDGTSPAYILVGKSLTEVEKHIAQLSLLTQILWAGTMSGSFVLTIILS